MSDCIFCAIVAGQAPASIVYEDDAVIAIMTIEPVNPGHTLVLPKKHFTYMGDMDDSTGAHLFTATRRVEQAIRKSGVRCEGINLHLADGEAAGQDVFHLHLHVIPRFKGDSYQVTAGIPVQHSRKELDEVAARIQKAYG